MRSSNIRSGQERLVLQIVGWVVIVAVVAGLFLLGYALGKRQCAGDQSPTAVPTVASTLPAPAVASPAVPAAPTIVPTNTPLPGPTPIPTPVPPTDTPAPAMIEAGPNGLNIRSGPDTSYTLLIHVEPGTRFRVIGRYEDWWQIDYNGVPAWAYSEVVTAFNTDNVPEVQPALSP